MQFTLAEALYYLNALPGERLGGVGVALLAEGRDTPAVRELAGLPPDATWRDAGDLFDRVLTELERPALTPREAAYRVAEIALDEVCAGTLTPYEGAARIAYGPYQAADMPDDLTPFYYWADEWEDHPEFREACEVDIRRAAEEWLTARRPPAP